MMLGLKPSVNVKRIGPNLVAGFHRANPPLIWKFDLERNHSFTIGLQGEDGGWELGLTSPKGDFYVIARFASHDDAEQAFNEVQKTLMRRRSFASLLPKTFIGWLGLLLLLVVIWLLWEGARGSSMPVGLSQMQGLPSVSMDHDTPKAGVPQPADDVLTPPK